MKSKTFKCIYLNKKTKPPKARSELTVKTTKNFDFIPSQTEQNVKLVRQV